MEHQLTYLSTDDFLKIFNKGRTLSHSFSQIIRTKLASSIIIRHNNIYKLNELNQYEHYGAATESIIMAFICEYMSFSYDKLSEDSILHLENELLKLNGKTTLNQFYKVLSNAFVRNHVASIKLALTNNDAVFDVDNTGIHFKNGRFNLKTRKLERRTPDMMITKIIDRDYKEPTKKHIKKWQNIIKQLFEDEETYNYMINSYGSMLNGDNVAHQRFLVNYGKGSAGKTTLLKFIESAVSSVYYTELKKDTLCFKNAKIDKIMNSFNSTIRFYIINEIDTSKSDPDLLKGIADGKVNFTKLYKDCNFSQYISGSMVLVGNHFISFPPDTGVNRRLRGCEYKHTFTDDESKIDNKTIFKKNPKLIQSKYHTLDDRNAIFQILADECYKFDQRGGEYDKPDSIKVFEEELIEINDEWAQIISNLLVKKKGGCALLTDIVKAIHDTVPTKSYIQRSQVLSSLKDRGINYDKNKMHNGKRGCILGYVLKCKNDFEGQSDESQVAFNRLKLTTEKLLAFISKQCPDHVDKLMDDIQKDIGDFNLNIECGKSEKIVKPKTTKTKTKTFNEKVKIKLSTSEKAQKEKEEKDKKVYEKRSKELKDKGKKNMKSSLKWFE